MTVPKTPIPPERADLVEHHAKARAVITLGLSWSSLSDAHREAVKQTIWAEMNWRD